MTYEQAGDAIRTRFKNEIKDPNSLQVQYDNQKDFAPPKELWCRVSIKFGDAVQASLGSPESRLYRNTGVVMIQIFDIIGAGDEAILQLADKINAAFRGVSVSELLFRTPSVSSSRREGDYWQVNVDCPFVFESIN
jgi:hypothetical protein